MSEQMQLLSASNPHSNTEVQVQENICCAYRSCGVCR